MAKSLSIAAARIVEAEQFHQSGNPEEWPVGIKWGGDLPGGSGCYVVTNSQGQDAQIADGDWIIAEDGGSGFYSCGDDVFRREYAEPC